MKNTLNQYLERFQIKQRKYRRYRLLFLILAVMTVIGVNWQLHRKGISMTVDVSGYEVNADSGQAGEENSGSSGMEDPDDGHSGSEIGSDDGNTDEKDDNSEDGSTDEKDDSSEDGSTDEKDDSSENGSTGEKDDSSEDGNAGEKDDSSEDGTSDGSADSSEDGENGNPDDESEESKPDETEDDPDNETSAAEDDKKADEAESTGAEKETGANAGGTSVKTPEVIPEEISVESEDPLDMTEYITGLTGNRTIYDEGGNIFSSDLRMDFTFPEETVNSEELKYYYDYPEGIIVPDGLIGEKYTLLDADGKKAGTYSFEEGEEEGRYRVQLEFDADYVNQKGEAGISGFIQFEGQIAADRTDEDGNIEIVGSDKVTLVIPADEIEYPGGGNNKYELKTSKSGSYVAKDGKLVYRVYVYSLKGTPGDIDLEDVITSNGGLGLKGSNVTVTKETVTRTFWENNGGWSDDTANIESEPLDTDDFLFDGEKLNMKLPKIEKAVDGVNSDGYACKKYTRYKVEYSYDVSGVNADSVIVNNEVTASSSDNTTEVISKSDAKVSVSSSYTISKDGRFASDRDLIRWEIKLNTNKMDIAGYKLTDDMLAKLAEGTKITIDPNNGYTINKGENGQVTDITFEAVEDGKNNNSYTITYWTPSGGGWESSTVTNTAHLTPGNGGNGVSDTTTVTVSGGTVAKEVKDAEVSEDKETAEVTWKSTVTMPADTEYIQEGTVIRDDPNRDVWGTTGGSQYLTWKQAKDWINDITWEDGNGSLGDRLNLTAEELVEIRFEASDGNEYTWQEISADADGSLSELTYTVCTITLKQNLAIPSGAKKLVFCYKTTADLKGADIGKNYYKNVFSVGNKKADALYEYNRDGVVKTDENNVEKDTQKTNSDGTLTWKIKVNIGSETGSLTFTDNLPAGVILKGLYGEDELKQLSQSEISIDEDGIISGSGEQYEISGEYDGEKVEVTVTSSAGKLPSKVYTLVLVCQVDKTAIEDYVSGNTYVFKNTASVSNENGKIGDADQTQEWTEDTTHEESKVISKTGKWDNNSRRLKYSIQLNPDEKDIVEGSDELILKDIFSYYNLVYALPDGTYQGTGTPYYANAWLIPDSVKLYRAVKGSDGSLTKGEEITDWNWTVTTAEGEYAEWDGGKTRTSTLTGSGLPDSTAMILEYDYQFETGIPEGYHADRMVASNDAELLGTAYKDSNKPSNMKWEKQSTTGAVTTDLRGVLYKVSKGNYGEVLPGAKFKLQKYNTSTRTYEDTDITYTTDQSGKLVIQWQKNANDDIQYKYNVLYRVVETDPPSGYLMPDHPENAAFYFYFSSSEDTSHTLPPSSDIPEGAADLAKSSSVVYVENESSSTKIRIRKVWLKPDGKEDTGRTGKIKVDLYRKESTTPSAGGGEASLTGKLLYDSTYGNVWMTIDDRYPAGSTVKLIITSDNAWIANPPNGNIPVIKVNGEQILPETDGWDTEKQQIVYTYTFQLTREENTIFGAMECEQWNIGYLTVKFQVQETDNETGTTTESPYGSYEITAAENWSKTIAGLPTKGVNAEGKTVYYTYYIKEVTEGNYTTSYSNNEGIISGEITVTNQLNDNPDYVLPETGGHGTKGYITAGMLMMGAALLCGYVVKIKKRHII